MLRSKIAPKLAALLLCIFLVPGMAQAKTANVIKAEVDDALATLYDTNKTAKDLSSSAKGILVFPDVTKAGLIIGGARGVGALRVNGETVRYYQTNSASIGFQAGVESRSEVIMFMTEDALTKFQNSQNWQAGVDGSITVVEKGASGSVNTKNQTQPIIGFIFGNAGLYGGLNFEGAKISSYTPE